MFVASIAFKMLGTTRYDSMLGAGPMHTVSSLCATCCAMASTSEWTETVRMPRERAVRITRQAISPRLATSTVLPARDEAEAEAGGGAEEEEEEKEKETPKGRRRGRREGELSRRQGTRDDAAHRRRDITRLRSRGDIRFDERVRGGGSF